MTNNQFFTNQINFKDMNGQRTITKSEIAEHFVTVDQLQEDLKNMVHDYYARECTSKVAV